MKTMLPYLIAFMISAAGSVAMGAGTSESVSREDVAKEVSEAIETILSYSIDRRDEALQQCRAVLDSLDARIERYEEIIRQQWHEMAEPARQQAREILRDLKDSRNGLAERYGGLAQSSSRAWEEMKKGFAKAYADLNASWENALREFEIKE